MTGTLGELLRYDRRNLRGDLVAGATVTAYLIPQVMAYATIAGLPAQTGLVVVVITLVVYAVIGSSRLLSVGPESTTALLTAAALAPLAAADPARYAALAALLAVMVGLLAAGAGVLRLGFIGDLLSRPVLVGYMAGVAVIMVGSQLGKLTGVETAGSTFVEMVRSFTENAVRDGVSAPTVLLGLSVTVALIVLSRRFPRLPAPLIVVLAATVLTWLLGSAVDGLQTVGAVAFSGVQFPVPSMDPADVQALALPAIGILVVGYADNVLTARALARRGSGRVHGNREFLALGGTNVAAGLAGGFPVSSSASRAVIGEQSGARTQLYSLVAAGLTAFAVLALSPVISAFPTAALGGLVVFAAIRLVDLAEFRRLWAFRRREFAIAVSATAGVLLFDILYGVLVAVGISVLELLTRVARPHAATLGQPDGVAGWHDITDYPGARQVPGLVVFRYDSPLFFANAEDFVTRAMTAVDAASPPARWLLLNMEGNTEIDITGADALSDVHRRCRDRGVVLALVRMKSEVAALLDAHGVGRRIGADHMFATLPVAVAAYQEWAGEPG